MDQHLEIKHKDFSRIPHALIDSGLLSKLKPSVIKVYLVLRRYANYKTGICFPTVDTTAKLAGINKNLVSKATDRLVEIGLIEKKLTSERFKHRCLYRVLELEPEDYFLISNTIPSKRGKCRKILKGKDGKFTRIPKNMDNLTPHFTESDTYPLKKDKKENLEINDRDIKRKRRKDRLTDGGSQAPFGGRNKLIKKANRGIIKDLIEVKGLEWTQKYFRKQGYREQEIQALKEVK